jgi:hypothetical protein
MMEVPMKADPWIDLSGCAHKREAVAYRPMAVLDDSACPPQWTIVLNRPADGDTLAGLESVRVLCLRLAPGTTAEQAHALAEHMAMVECLEAIHDDPAGGGGTVLQFRRAA